MKNKYFLLFVSNLDASLTTFYEKIQRDFIRPFALHLLKCNFTFSVYLVSPAILLHDRNQFGRIYNYVFLDGIYLDNEVGFVRHYVIRLVIQSAKEYLQGAIKYEKKIKGMMRKKFVLAFEGEVLVNTIDNQVTHSKILILKL